MTKEQTDKLLKELSQTSLILAVLSGLPYSLGTAADILPPEAKKWITLVAGVSAALMKIVQLVINGVSGLPNNSSTKP